MSYSDGIFREKKLLYNALLGRHIRAFSRPADSDIGSIAQREGDRGGGSRSRYNIITKTHYTIVMNVMFATCALSPDRSGSYGSVAHRFL